jgi:hypothetical protein
MAETRNTPPKRKQSPSMEVFEDQTPKKVERDERDAGSYALLVDMHKNQVVVNSEVCG